MNICFLNHNLKSSSGAGRFGLKLVGELLKGDPHIRATILTTEHSGDARELAILPANWVSLLFSMHRIRRVFRDADIIHALDGYPYGVIAAVASRGLGKRLIITAIGTGAIQPLSDWRRLLMSWAYQKADKVVAISNYTKYEIQKYLPDLRVEVVNHAVDMNDFRPEPTLGEVEKRAIQDLKPYILSVGGWKKRKGFEYSFKAFAEIQKRHPHLRYVVCGIGPKPHLEEQFGLRGKVSYYKGMPWPFLRELYRNAELFMLLPVDDKKDVEGFGFVFLEAAASGLPVVGTLGSGAEDAVLDGQNGYLVLPRDAHAAALAAERILQDPKLRQSFAQASISFAEFMNWQRVRESYQALYANVLGTSHK